MAGAVRGDASRNLWGKGRGIGYAEGHLGRALADTGMEVTSGARVRSLGDRGKAEIQAGLVCTADRTSAPKRLLAAQRYAGHEGALHRQVTGFG